ncbi:alanine racemase [Aureimonas sp. OT7]|nr:alanine racemase [Aureimonas sp. OT7]
MSKSHSPTRLDPQTRGVPLDLPDISVDGFCALGLRPAHGETGLPILTLDAGAFDANTTAMMNYVRGVGARIAPHAKTPMSPALAAKLVAAGADGLTVADGRQAAVMLAAGFRKLLLANEIGGEAAGRRLGELLRRYPDCEISVFVDSPAAVCAAAAAALAAERTLACLIEVGTGRAGARSRDAARTVIDAVADSKGLALGGVATYEGAAVTADAAETLLRVDDLCRLAGEVLGDVRARNPGQQLVLSAGGSAFFDRVIAVLGPVCAADGACTLLLRSGAIFFHDHGIYARALAAMDERGGFSPGASASASFTPSLRVFAEVLSRPEADLAICGLGMRDISFDQGLPLPVGLYRGGRSLSLPQNSRLVRLNDQHAFVALSPGSDVAVGDILAFGLSHPCTALDRWSHIFVLDDAGAVRRVLPTFFG